ncbi:hypothetical protein DJ72_11085, partial [Halorubrum distributum]
PEPRARLLGREPAVEHSVRVGAGTPRDEDGEEVPGFYVEDDGTGLPDDADRVFDSGFTTEESGTGLGLAISERIAEAHGWTVELAESETGGTRFEFRGVEVESSEGGA